MSLGDNRRPDGRFDTFHRRCARRISAASEVNAMQHTTTRIALFSMLCLWACSANDSGDRNDAASHAPSHPNTSACQVPPMAPACTPRALLCIALLRSSHNDCFQ